MKVFIEKDNKKIEIKFKGDAKALLLKLNINPENVLIVKNNEIVQEDELISEKDEIKLLSVISGG